MTRLGCPRCAAELEVLLPGAHGCPGCGGAWLDNTVSQWVAAGETPIALEERDRPYPLARGDESSPRACPTCSAPLVVVAIEGVELEICASHGTWFDASELRYVSRAVKQRIFRARFGLATSPSDPVHVEPIDAEAIDSPADAYYGMRDPLAQLASVVGDWMEAEQRRRRGLP